MAKETLVKVAGPARKGAEYWKLDVLDGANPTGDELTVHNDKLKKLGLSGKEVWGSQLVVKKWKGSEADVVDKKK